MTSSGPALVTAIDASGDDQAYTYDALGRMTSRTDGIGGTLTWTYDVRGNRLTQANRVGSPSVAVTWAYDKADRNTSRVADSATTSYTWNANGQLLTATNSIGTITVTYDRLGRQLTVDPDDGSSAITWTYTSFTSEQRVDVTGTTTATLDTFGRETSLVTPMTANPFTFTYRADGQRATQGDPSGATTTLTHDRLGRLTDKDVTDADCTSGTCATLDWTYNRSGQRLTEAQDTMCSGCRPHDRRPGRWARTVRLAKSLGVRRGVQGRSTVIRQSPLTQRSSCQVFVTGS